MYGLLQSILFLRGKRRAATPRSYLQALDSLLTIPIEPIIDCVRCATLEKPLTRYSSKVDPVAAIIEITGGGVDFAFDTIGVRETNEQILPSTRGGGAGADNHGGMAVLIGIPGGEMTLDPRLFTLYQRIYRGSLGAAYPHRDLSMFLRWYRDGKFPLDKLVTRRYSLEQINEACDALWAGDIFGRAIIEY